MKFWSDSFKDGERIPVKYAFGKWHPETKIELSQNLNPHFQWSDLPPGTQSLALICCDPDVPSRPDNVNQEGKTVSALLPRVNFYHWALVDLSPSVEQIKEGEFSRGITPKGKDGPDSLYGTRQGINNYMQWFEGDEAMAGKYFGYDGPCPPWNDEILHHYQFTLYALSEAKCDLHGEFAAADVEAAIKPYTLAQVTLTGVYAINPQVG